MTKKEINAVFVGKMATLKMFVFQKRELKRGLKAAAREIQVVLFAGQKITGKMSVLIGVPIETEKLKPTKEQQLEREKTM